MTRMAAIKKFFHSDAKPVTNTELLDFARTDKKGYEEIGDLCLAALGEKLDKAETA